MDFKMPPAQKSAWNELKKAVNEYAETTGSEIGVVTSYARQEAEDGPLSSERSLALHGHGDILRRLRGCLEMIKSKTSTQKTTGNGMKQTNFGTGSIPIKNKQPIHGEETHYSQAVARSLCSSFQSLKLEPLQFEQYNSSHSAIKASNSVNSGPVKRGNKRARKKNDRSAAINGGGDGLELDENLLFEEEGSQHSSDDSDESDFDDSDDDDDDDDVILRPAQFGHHNAPQLSALHRTETNAHTDSNQFATSLPVNISANFAHRPDGPLRFIDNQGPHPTTYQRAHPQPRAPTTTYANRSRPIQHGFQDTPNPETMMASMQALARSVTDDSSRIFGERPRPRLNTGEQRQVRAHH